MRKTKPIRCDAFKKFLGPKLDDAIMRDIEKLKTPEQRARDYVEFVDLALRQGWPALISYSRHVLRCKLCRNIKKKKT